MPVFDPEQYKRDKSTGGNQLIPLGKHIVQVSDHTFDRTSNGHGQVIVTFRREDGATRRGYLIYEGKGGRQFADLLTACEWAEPLDLDDAGQMRQAIYDKDVEIVVKNDTYNGITSPRVQWINRAPNGTGQARRSPADRFAGGAPSPRSYAPAASDPSARMPEGQFAPPPADDEDIPF